GKIRRGGGVVAVLVENGKVFALDLSRDPAIATLADLLHLPNPLQACRGLIDTGVAPEPLGAQTFLAPIDRQEVWAAGVTYKRSKIAREEESRSGAIFYDKVYEAARPELFFKANPHRVAGPGEAIHIRRDATWNVPEPELTLVFS